MSQVTDMSEMLSQAKSFNQDLSKWNVGKVTNMQGIFSGASAFKQTLCGEAWAIPKASKKSMFVDSPGTISCIRFQPKITMDLIAALDACLGR